jgi:simple sugar transport system permease protein
VVPAQFVWTIIFAVVIWFFLNRHKFGAHVYLTGDNVESARLMGVNVDQTKILAFAITGFAAAFAGFVVSVEVIFFWPTLGDGYLLNTLASVFLGGTSVFGGTGTIFGTFVACFIIGAINAGIVAAGLTGFWTNLIYGLIIVVSVALQAVVGRRFR